MATPIKFHPLGERNPKYLQDDYVKFIRFAQWKLDQAGEGILAFITNHGYLDNPTFRGMRQSLMRSFDRIYLLDLHGNTLRKEIAPVLTQALATCFKKPPMPEEIFYYIYAVLYSPMYRAKYAEFLKSDFPRIPFTADNNLFHEMSEIGKDIANQHLLRSPALEKPQVRFRGDGDNRVEKPSYDPASQRVSINQCQYFEEVPLAVWDYHIGGYRIMDRWLRDRKSRCLSFDDIRHYCRIATALALTIKLQSKADSVYQKIEKRDTFVDCLSESAG